MMHVQIGNVTIAISGNSLLLLKGDLKSTEILAEANVTNEQGEAWRDVVKAMDKKGE